MPKNQPFDEYSLEYDSWFDTDKNSEVGRGYQQHKKEIIYFLRNAGFQKIMFKQTIFQDIRSIKSREPIKNGYGEGSFVVATAIKK